VAIDGGVEFFWRMRLLIEGSHADSKAHSGILERFIEHKYS